MTISQTLTVIPLMTMVLTPKLGAGLRHLRRHPLGAAKHRIIR